MSPAASPPTVGEVAAALAALAPPGVRTGCRAVTPDAVAALHETESVAVVRAVASRRREFATGRALLRDLLGGDVAIGVRPDRAPAWPAGTVGSLAHSGPLAVAVTADAEVVAALGVDIEPTTRLEPELAEVILRPDDGVADAHLAFTLKEAFYKAWSSLGGAMLEHHDVRVVPGAPGWFDATEVTGGTSLAGRFAVAGGYWVALVVVARPR